MLKLKTMKKLILTIGLATFSASLFAQGSFIFQSSARAVWDCWSAVANKADASNNVAFLIGTGTPKVIAAAGGAQTATNATGLPNGLSLSAAWADILDDPNFTLATNMTSQSLVMVKTTTTGIVAYNAGATFLVTNTAALGGTATIFVIGWDYRYATPWLAAAANSPLGWSSVFNYTYVAGPVPGPTGLADNMVGRFQFGVQSDDPISGVIPVPEPATMALAGLGGLSLLLFRRRKV